MTEPWTLGASAMVSAFRDGSLSPLEAVTSCIERIESLDSQIGAVTVLLADQALDAARAANDGSALGDEPGPLHGVPIVIKELFDVAGAETTFGSYVFEGRVPTRDAAAVAQLKAAGAIVLGLTRTHEFAWGITTQHETKGGTNNPWNVDRIPGGSSGGSAAAVASGMAPLGLGSDTGGSIRIPAAFCGITGFKPTFGTVDSSGSCPLAPSLDHVGPLARSVEDCALALASMSEVEVPSWRDDLKGLVLITSPDLHMIGPQHDHQKIFDAGLEVLRGLGATIESRPFRGAEILYPTYAVVQRYEGYEVHADLLETYPSQADRYSPSVRKNLEVSSTVTEDDYLLATMERDRIRVRFKALIQGHVLVTPASGGPPSLTSRPDTSTLDGVDIALRELVMHYTTPQDLAGLPAIVVPAGLDDAGLPVGIQFTAGMGRDADALIAARAFQQVVNVGWPTAL